MIGSFFDVDIIEVSHVEAFVNIVKFSIISIFIGFFSTTGNASDGTKKLKSVHSEKRVSPNKNSSNEIFVGLDVGVPVDANSRAVRSGKKTFDQSESGIGASYMGAVRFGWKSKPESLVMGYGLGALYGNFSSRGGTYAAGDVELGVSALYGLGFARIGYYFTKKISASLQVESYLPFTEKIVVTSPNGEVKESPDGSFEVSTHSALLMIQYDTNPNLSLGLNIYIPALIYSSIQGRGFTGLTAGVDYDL